MVDITHKAPTLRIAKAQAIVKVSNAETIKAIENKTVPKGDVFEMSRTAGLLGIKKTPHLLPDCHPLPIEFAAIDYRTEGLDINITVTVKTIYKTGVEVEAMHGASVVALNIYDMLKPIDKEIEIREIKLLGKSGGKSSRTPSYSNRLKAAVIVCSDSISEGMNEDKAGIALIEKLKDMALEVAHYDVIPDEKAQIQNKAQDYSNFGVELIIFCGGTGMSPRDVTPEALEGILDRRIPGMEETIRNYGQQRTPYAMLSRSVAGTLGNSLVLALPGSVNGSSESLDAIFPAALHIFTVMKGKRHE